MLIRKRRARRVVPRRLKHHPQGKLLRWRVDFLAHPLLMRLAVRLHENQSHPRRRPPQGDVRVLPTDESEARLLADLQRAGIQCHLRREGGRGDFLRQHMRAVP